MRKQAKKRVKDGLIPSAINVTKLVILPENVERRKIGVTSVMVLVTLPRTAAKTRTPATTVTRSGTS